MKISGYVKIINEFLKKGLLDQKKGKIHVFHEFGCCLNFMPFCDCSPKLKIEAIDSPDSKQGNWEIVHYHKDNVYNVQNSGVRSCLGFNKAHNDQKDKV